MATITGNLAGIVNTAAEAGSVEIALCGYGSQVPRAQGEALYANVTAQDIQANSDGTFSITVAGNDEIAPQGTYYTITVKDANGDVIQINAYMFLADESYDLNTVQPFDPTQGPGPLPPLIINQLLIIPFTATPNFPGDQYLSWAITLTGDVTSSTLSGMVQGNLYTFIIQQDSIGGRKFVWPPGVMNPAPVDPEATGLTIQTFIAIANGTGPLLPIGPATYYP